MDGEIKEEYHNVMSDPSGVAARWVSNVVYLAITCGVKNVLLSMLHARMEWCEYVWRFLLSSPQAKALLKVNEALLALLPRDWSFCKEGVRVSLASTLFAIPNRKKTKAGPNTGGLRWHPKATDYKECFKEDATTCVHLRHDSKMIESAYIEPIRSALTRLDQVIIFFK